MGGYHSIKKFSSSFPGSDFDRITKIRFYPKKIGFNALMIFKTHPHFNYYYHYYLFIYAFLFFSFFSQKRLSLSKTKEQ